MKEKVLAIVARQDKGQIQFLALRNNPADPAHGGDFYYVVTGSTDGEEHEEAVRRELKEETGIENLLKIKILPVTKTFTDNWGNECRETMFALVTDEDVKHLSIEHIDHQWLVKEQFASIVRWYGSEEELMSLIAEVESLFQ